METTSLRVGPRTAPGARRLASVIAAVALGGVTAGGALAYLRYAWYVPPPPPACSPEPPLKWQQLEDALTRFGEQDLGWETAPRRELERIVRRYRRLARRARAALGELRRSRAPNWDDNGGGYHYAAQLFLAGSRLARLHGDHVLALERALDAMEWGALLARGGGVDSRIAAILCQEEGTEQAQKIVPRLRRRRDRRRLAASLARLKRIRRSWPAMTAVLARERQVTLAVSARELARTSQGSLVNQLRQARAALPRWHPAPEWADPLCWRLVLTPRQTLLSDLDLYFDRCIREARLPLRRQKDIPPPGHPWITIARQCNIGFVYLFPYAWYRRPYKGEKARNDLILLEAALALRIHFLRHGRYPERLSRLDRDLAPPATDIWDQPLGYRSTGKRVALYSWGPDGRDDGGRAVDRYAATKGVSGDLVFGHL